MQTYDVVMLVVLVGMTMFGFAKGMAWQIAYFSSFIVSYFVALRFSAQLAPTFGQSEEFNRVAAMLAIYVATSFGIWMLFRVVANAIDRVKLKEFDRQMGALVGFARGVLWCIAITFFAATLLESQRDAILGSRAGHYIAVILDKSHTMVPEEIHVVIHPYVERIQQGIDPNRPPNSSEGGGAIPWPGGTAPTNPWPSTTPPSQPPAGPAPWPTQPAGQNNPAAPAPWPTGNHSASQSPARQNY